MTDHKEQFGVDEKYCIHCINMACHTCGKDVQKKDGYYCQSCYAKMFNYVFDYDDD